MTGDRQVDRNRGSVIERYRARLAMIEKKVAAVHDRNLRMHRDRLHMVQLQAEINELINDVGRHAQSDEARSRVVERSRALLVEIARYPVVAPSTTTRNHHLPPSGERLQELVNRLGAIEQEVARHPRPKKKRRLSHSASADLKRLEKALSRLTNEVNRLPTNDERRTSFLVRAKQVRRRVVALTGDRTPRRSVWTVSGGLPGLGKR